MTTFASECLWDCEAATRQIGAAESDLTDPLTRARINALAASEAEDQAVRTASIARLSD
ncbi:MAG: hypothetical protein ACKV2O_01605 [Acidimicrobiales bacterium]